MIKQMDMEFMSIKMELDMRENGKMIYNMDRVKRFGQIIRCMRDTIMKGKSMEKVFIFGKMDLAMTETGLKIE